MQAAPISLRSAKKAINEGLETDILTGMKVEECQYAEVTLVLERRARDVIRQTGLS